MFLKDRGKTALVYNDLKITYKELLNKVDYFSRLYNSNTTEKVVVFSENRLGWIYSFYAGWKNNNIVVPVDFMSTPKEVAHILNDSTPEVIFCSKDRLETLTEALKDVSHETNIIIIDEYEDKTSSNASDLQNPNLNDTAVIIYTSGTTGSPKGVMLSYENILMNVDAVSNGVNIYNPYDTVLALLPLHHIFPLLGTVVCPLFVGSSIAMSPSMASEDIIDTMQNNSVSVMIGVPRLYNVIRKGIKDKIDKSAVAKLLFSIADKVNSYSFSRFVFKAVHKKFGGALKYLVCGGAAIDPVVARDYQILGFEMLEGYGMTEAAPMITFTRPGRVKIGSAGEALPGVEIEVRDEEIVARGKNVMQGYYNREKETNEVLKDGWLYTGDLGHIDEKGFIYITGRKKEIIVLSNGKNINPVEIEFSIEDLANGLINEIGVFMKDDLLQAVIYPDKVKIRELNVDDIEKKIRWDVINKYNSTSSPSKKIMKFTIVDTELPKTRLSKIQRFKLADLTNETIAEVKKEDTIDLKEYNIIKEYIENEKGLTVSPENHIEIDLGLDSLDKVGLHVFINSTFGVNINVEDLTKYQSVLKLSEYISEVKVKISVEKVNWSDILKEKVHLNLPKSWITSNIIIKISKYFFYAYFRFKGKGLKNIPDTPCIIAPNHQSFFDGLFVASFLKNKTMRKTYFYAKAKHVKRSWVKSFANRNNVIVMDINQDLKLSIQKMAEALRMKKNIIIFPEGTRSSNGKLGNFKKTFAILSKELNVPVVPVTISGADKALPSGTKFPRPFKKISVEFLKPIYPKGHSYETLASMVEKKINYSLKAS